MLRISKYGFFLIIIFLVLSSCKKEQSAGKEQSVKFVKLFGGEGADYATDLVSFGDGYALTGTILTSDSANQAFLIATDEFGNELPWSPVIFGGKLNDIGNKIFRLQSGDFIVVGTQVLSLAEKDSSDIFVVKIGVDGVIKWNKRYGGTSKEEGFFGIESFGNNIIIGGFTESSVGRAKNVVLYKLDTNGNELWSSPSSIGAARDEIGYDIIERNDSIFVVGLTNVSGLNSVYIALLGNSAGQLIKFDNLYLGNGNFSGVKISFIPNTNDLMILAQYTSLNSNKKEISILRLGIGTESQLFPLLWERRIATVDNEVSTDLILRSNDFLVIGNRIGGNSNIFSHSFNFYGDKLDSAFLYNSGNQSGNAAIISLDGKICIAGSNGIQNKSQIALVKGLLQ